ncbi:type II toxin-antitoxin system ParD family antitoxin [Acidisoma cellulosilytica]|uniref:Type II toxin-antitoxin system ParD family antitoxin n=1 Tax=Acidisoma cellulosilyticum TaxID=2802395 RepID=A0A963Z2F4_9PROT|nr:type II toxin-antitoxin system ParD family antitoxin [Acidisoma cellulosilyticum]MCB8880722.1 type II toxin-antitoxin system ParD family antitoxin [Acidisoma cellulosilyticum]
MPAAPRTISFTEHHLSLMDSLVSAGHHASSSEVIREALRRYEADLDREQAHLAYLQRLGDQGEAEIARGAYKRVAPEDLGAFLASLGRDEE